MPKKTAVKQSHRAAPREAGARQDLLLRLRRVEGQVRGVQKMVEEERYCPDVLVQMSAIHESLRAVERALDERPFTALRHGSATLRRRQTGPAHLRRINRTLLSARPLRPSISRNMDSEKTVKDPVCNMDVVPATARGSSEYKGQTYYFCSQSCVQRFNADPEKYLAPKPPASQIVQIGGITRPSASKRNLAPAIHQQSAKGSVTYVCPMDPEVRESKTRRLP